jgi:hypothetical protein
MSNVLNFKNWVRVYEQTTAPGGATVKLLGETGIKVVTYAKDTSFQPPDNKPYILLLTGDVSFEGAGNVDITLRSNGDDPGAYKKPYGAEGEGQPLVTSITPSFYESTVILSEIVKALYGGVTADGVYKTVTAMKLIKSDYPTEIANNSLFTNFRKHVVGIYNSGTVQKFYANLQNKNASNTLNLQALFDGVRKAYA